MGKEGLGQYDQIIMKDMAFFGYHGVMKEESVLGQKFILSVKLYLNTKEAGMSDDLTKTISYAEVYNRIKKQVETMRYQLLEALSENIAKDILSDFDLVKGVTVEVKKPEAPVPGIFDYMAVKITRTRD